jgi:cell division transport system permease protein
MSASNDRTGPPELPGRTRPRRDEGYPELEPSPGPLRPPREALSLQPDRARAPARRPLAEADDGLPPTGPPTDTFTEPPRLGPADPERAEIESDLAAPAREDGQRLPRAASIVPASTVTGRSLAMVIVIMCFLACLTAGAVYMINQSAAAWLRDIASEVTVQIEPKDKVDTERLVADVVSFLRKQPGLAKVQALTTADSVALLEPWLGNAEVLGTLPVPRLVALEIDRGRPADLAALRAQLERQFKGVTLDDHRQWQNQIRTVTRSFALGGIGILVLVALATMAIIVSATKSAMLSNREIVEVLHFVGATDRFIAREFERHFLTLGVRAGFVGAALAMLVFFLVPYTMELLGGGTVSAVELKRLVGSGALDLTGYVLLGIVVVVVAALCMLTSRFGVKRILHSTERAARQQA